MKIIERIEKKVKEIKEKSLVIEICFSFGN